MLARAVSSGRSTNSGAVVGEKIDAKLATALKMCRKNAALLQKGSKGMCPRYPDWRRRLEEGRADEWAAGAGGVLLAMKL